MWPQCNSFSIVIFLYGMLDFVFCSFPLLDKACCYILARHASTWILMKVKHKCSLNELLGCEIL